VLSTVTEDATWSRFNDEQMLSWGRPGGDWIDAEGTPWGDAPFSSARIVDDNAPGWEDLDVTAAVRSGGGPLFVIRSGGRSFTFDSDEAADASVRPHFRITGSDGKSRYVDVDAASLDGSTSKVLGFLDTFTTRSRFLILADVPDLAASETVTLRIHSTGKEYSSQTLNVFVPQPTPAPVPDAGVPPATREILSVGPGEWPTVAPVEFSRSPDDGRHVEELADGTLRIHWPDEGGQVNPFAPHVIIPIEDRAALTVLAYTMKVGADFFPGTTGKFPGLANTGHTEIRTVGLQSVYPPETPSRRYGGFGGRAPNDGTWTARVFMGRAASGPFASAYSPIDTYAYTQDDGDLNGVLYGLTRPLPRMQWVTIVQAVDTERGLLAHWLVTPDGAWPIGFKTGLIFYTDADRAKFPPPALYPSTAWVDFHVGGTGYEKVSGHGGHTIWLESMRVLDGLPDMALEAARLVALNDS
ncbi:MAG: hypothetical protein AAF311_16530, partial [Pseudomonadota bacterium]